jgi:23S rRNA pseudouridine2605 synthase
MADASPKLRLQRFLAESGVASRRASEQLILAGRVAVNRQIVRQLGVRVDPVADSVSVDGATVKPRRRLYVALNKPRGVLCTRKDPEGRKTVLDLLPAEWTDVYPIGRLDADTEGLLLLTNDGEFCLRLTHPRYRVRKLYWAAVAGRVEPEILRHLTKGVFSRGERLRADRARLLRSGRSFSIVELELTEGKNREVRRLFETQDLSVRDLSRQQIGPIKLGELKPGRWRTLSPAEVQALRTAGEAPAAATRPPSSPRRASPAP